MGKLMQLFLHSIASFVIAECACASLMLTSFIDVPSLVCVDPRYMNWSTASRVFPFFHMLVDGLGLMRLTRGLLLSGVDFHAVTSNSFQTIDWARQNAAPL